MALDARAWLQVYHQWSLGRMPMEIPDDSAVRGVVSVPEFWDEETEPIVVERNKRGDQIHIRRTRKGKIWYVDVRLFYRDSEGNMRPTSKGLTLPIGEIASRVADAIAQLNI